MLADLIDAVVGVDTHRDTHHVEIALPTGTPGCSTLNWPHCSPRFWPHLGLVPVRA